jgi:hypothetical protein
VGPDCHRENANRATLGCEMLEAQAVGSAQGRGMRAHIHRQGQAHWAEAGAPTPHGVRAARILFSSVNAAQNPPPHPLTASSNLRFKAAAAGWAMDGGGTAPPDAAANIPLAPSIAAAPAGISTLPQPSSSLTRLPPSIPSGSCRFRSVSSMIFASTSSLHTATSTARFDFHLNFPPCRSSRPSSPVPSWGLHRAGEPAPPSRASEWGQAWQRAM